MLDNVSEQLRECIEAAESCRRKAAATPKALPCGMTFSIWSGAGLHWRGALDLANGSIAF
jgi:hypothetical protein